MKLLIVADNTRITLKCKLKFIEKVYHSYELIKQQRTCYISQIAKTEWCRVYHP